jgi:hypothetical protein
MTCVDQLRAWLAERVTPHEQNNVLSVSGEQKGTDAKH